MGSIPMYVVLVRDKGLFLVEPVEGKPQGETIEDALELKVGYSTGLVYLDLPRETEKAWVAWVEGENPDGSPYFEYRAFDGALTEEQVLDRLREAGEEPLKMNLTEVHWAS